MSASSVQRGSNQASMLNTTRLADAGRARTPSGRTRRWMDDLASRCGIELNGVHPYDLRVHNDAFYTRALPRGLSGLLDAYVEGWWDCDRLDELTARVLAADFLPLTGHGVSEALRRIGARLFNRQNHIVSRDVRRHYDLGIDLFTAMLDARMIYSCAYWKDASNLDQAQEHKLDLICRKMGIRPGARVLDIGCGWGGFARYAAETRGADVTGITVCPKQYQHAREAHAGPNIDIRLADYRDLGNEVFDVVVSVGMFEHVGYKNYRTFLRVAHRCLRPGGLLLLHTIGGNTSEIAVNAWLDRNVFPHAMLPSARQITAAAEGLFVIEDWHNFGADYDRTLMAWFANFDAGWPALEKRYGARFYRLWKCYLLTCAGSFRTRENQLWQIVLSPRGVAGGYTSIR